MGNNTKFNYKFMQMANIKKLGYKRFIRWRVVEKNIGLALLVDFCGEVSVYKKIKSFFNSKLAILSNRLAREYCYK